MRWFIVIVFMFFVLVPAGAVTLTGGVEYTVESAREEAFSGVVYKMPLEVFSRYLSDPNFVANKKAMAEGREELGDRWVVRFESGGYNVVYKNDRYKEYSYDSKGKLETLGIRSGLDFPAKSYQYDMNGNLYGVTFYLSNNDIYIYTETGVLEYHWVGDKCYDINGKIIDKVIK